MAPASKQDVQNIIDTMRNRIMERVALRQDVQYLTDYVKNLQTISQQNQQLLRQGEYQHLQMARRAVALEARMTALEGEIRSMRITMSKLAEQQNLPQRLVTPVQPVGQPPAAPLPNQYLYSPAE